MKAKRENSGILRFQKGLVRTLRGYPCVHSPASEQDQSLSVLGEKGQKKIIVSSALK